MKTLVGHYVELRDTKERGIIKKVTDDMVWIEFNDEISQFLFPSSFVSHLVLDDKSIQEEIEALGVESAFNDFKKKYSRLINNEIAFLRKQGGKKYTIFDGVMLSSNNKTYVYVFDTDSEYHFPDGSVIKIEVDGERENAYVIACEEYSITFQTTVNLGAKVSTLSFFAEPWQLLEEIIERLDSINSSKSKIAYELANSGYTKIKKFKGIVTGQNAAHKRATSPGITFIWGPPGTGKTTTLAKIALKYIDEGKRVLMTSYSNVSVDGALLKVDYLSSKDSGVIVRYGYPRDEALINSDTLTSYSLALTNNPELANKYKNLIESKKGCKRTDPKRVELTKQIKSIRDEISKEEKAIVINALFVATTLTKAITDRVIYDQRFDVVIVDEASMAYVPQIVCVAGLAEQSFCCLGDFKQLPAIVQNPKCDELKRDIFDYVGICKAVNKNYSHEWLVMLNEQFRMHQDIADFVSGRMYGGLLETSPTIEQSRDVLANVRPLRGSAMIGIDLSGMYSVCIKTAEKSRINLMSALFCVRLAEKYVESNEVGIITPYNAQSKLITAMLRDLSERNGNMKLARCTTVHQFQGSEKPIIIYDSVDCYRMAYPSMLLTEIRDDIANRLFNVALTRAQGKFVLVSNIDYLFKKKISKGLIFTDLLKKLNKSTLSIKGDRVYDEIGSVVADGDGVFLGDRDEVESWDLYLKDIKNSKKIVHMDIPGSIDDDDEALLDLKKTIGIAQKHKVDIVVRTESARILPEFLERYRKNGEYIAFPITIVDDSIIWYGQPLSSADFISEGDMFSTRYFPVIRFEGKHTCRMLKAVLGITGVDDIDG
ncbi:MAG: AAA family ATPase [Lachnospiraceae bacterium]|nr:AAA family ATPase [Lachnospiraceae bacterium]